MNSDINISLEESREPKDGMELAIALSAYNNSVAEPANPKHFLFSAKDREGNLVGGIRGYSHWNYLNITYLWVSETQRGKKLGSELIKRAEDFARKQNVMNAIVDTYSFQALPFYLKHGYTEFACLNDYPVGASRHFLRKSL